MAKLHFYYSAMNAGKSTTLLQSNYNYKERGMRTLLFITAIDTRYAPGVIHSRIGLTSEAHVFDKDFDLFEFVKEYIKTEKINCVLVDDAHFMTKEHVLQLARIVDELNIPTLAYGLRSDFMGEPFESSQYLLALAEELVEIKTICHCGRKATMNARIDKNGRFVQEGEQFEVGGNERYISVCRKHFMHGEVSFSEQTSDKILQKAV